MASNPAAANVTSRSSSLSGSDQNLRMGSSRQIGGSQFGRRLPVDFGASGNTMRPEADTLYRIHVAEHRPQVDGSFETMRLNETAIRKITSLGKENAVEITNEDQFTL